ncbi:hypothetical protein A5777_11640 [Gordonia sp. 852002-10350_SCH5691597]|nr:hypothetical protein A5777_11640 [Gordonia sp. 852002-10350_SCH5691597]
MQTSQHAGGDRIQLADMTEPELPQERSQRRRGIRVLEHPAHRAVPQYCHVVDAVGAGHHARDQREHLAIRVGALIGGHAQMLAGQPRQAGLFGQRHHRHQPSRAEQIRIITHGRPDRMAMRQSHLRDALLRVPMEP